MFHLIKYQGCMELIIYRKGLGENIVNGKVY